MRININVGGSAKASGLFFGVLIALFIGLLAVSVHFLTIEPDEAWNLLSTGQIAGGPFDGAEIVTAPVVTSGGIHTLIHYLLLWFGLPIEVHRLVSLLFGVLTLLL